jgi:aconitase B
VSSPANERDTGADTGEGLLCASKAVCSRLGSTRVLCGCSRAFMISTMHSPDITGTVTAQQLQGLRDVADAVTLRDRLAEILGVDETSPSKRAIGAST